MRVGLADAWSVVFEFSVLELVKGTQSFPFVSTATCAAASDKEFQKHSLQNCVRRPLSICSVRGVPRWFADPCAGAIGGNYSASRRGARFSTIRKTAACGAISCADREKGGC